MSAAQPVPAVVGLLAREDEQVAVVEPGRACSVTSGQSSESRRPLRIVERRPPRPVVEQLVGVEPRDHGGAVAEDVEDGRRRRSRVDPAVERRDHDRRRRARAGDPRACTAAWTESTGRAARCGETARSRGPIVPLRAPRPGACSAAHPAATSAAGHVGVLLMLGRVARLFSLLLFGWFVFMIGAAATRRSKGRDSVTPEPDADEIDLVTTFGPMEYHSTAASFRGGTVTDVVRRRDARPPERDPGPGRRDRSRPARCSAAAT